MSHSLYEISIPVFIRQLTNLSSLLKKGQAYADEKGMDHSKLLEAKLADDMAGLIFQIQRVSDTVKGYAVRVGGVPNVSMEDNEKTFADVQGRLEKTLTFLKGVEKSSINGKEEKEVVYKAGANEFKFTGTTYTLNYAIPNLFFHVVTAYDIMRHMGVPVGKLDYLGVR